MATKARKKLKVSKFDEADYLNPEDCAEYLKACIEDSDGDSAVIAEALGVIARARGMGKVGKSMGSLVRVFTRRSTNEAIRLLTLSYACQRRSASN